MSLPATFQGFARASGRPGIRNHLVILSVCGLNTAGARKVAAHLPGAVLISSPFGRGQLGPDRTFHDAMLKSFATHPNTGAVVILAADRAMRLRYQEAAEAAGRPAAGFSLQEAGEDGPAMVRDAVTAGQRLQTDLARAGRVEHPISSLAIAVECGHSDASSGIVANPLVGDLVDALCDAGGAAVISETVEWLGTEDRLRARCVSPDVARDLDRLVADRHAIAERAGEDLHRGNPGPQNHNGGITTLEEKSLGAVMKGGTGPIVAALAQGAPLGKSGLHLMDTPALSPESISSMVAGGAQLVCFTTGQGNPYGSALAPTVKITANPDTALRLPGQIDLDASEAFTGAKDRAALLPALCARIAEVCSGTRVAAEWDGEGDEVISRLGPSV